MGYIVNKHVVVGNFGITHFRECFFVVPFPCHIFWGGEENTEFEVAKSVWRFKVVKIFLAFQ